MRYLSWVFYGFLMFLWPVSHAGSFVSIGPGGDCHYNTAAGETLQDALNDMPAEIRLVDAITYSGTHVTQGSVFMRGGFATCSDANNNNQFVSRSTLNGLAAGVVLDLAANGNYQLEQVELTNGMISSGTGGGLKLSAADLVVTIRKSKISQNTGNLGGGIGKGVSSNAILNIIDSVIEGNTANNGGGVYFRGQGQLNFFGDSAITGNVSNNFGGGLWLQETHAVFIGGDNPDINSGITFNSSQRDGGGMYIVDSSVEMTGGYYELDGFGVLGTINKSFNVLFNQSDIDNNGSGSGGGMAVLASTVNMAAVAVSLNESKASAGGIWAINNSTVNIKRTLYPALNMGCHTGLPIGCNAIIGNLASSVGGGLYYATSSEGVVEAANISGNRANNSTALFVTGATTDLTVKASVIYDNGAGGSTPYNDNYTLRVNDNGQLTLDHVTAIENDTNLAFVYNNNGNLASFYNYFYNPTTGPWVLENGNTSTSFNCMVVDDTNNSSDVLVNLFAIGGALHSLQFVDLPNRNLHLKDDSDLVDYQAIGCPPNPQGYSMDIDGDPRTAYADLGADENLSNDIIFENGFGPGIDL